MNGTDDDFRFNLVRDLRAPIERSGPPMRVLGWVMLNPSKAHENNFLDVSGFDDPTIRRCKAFARREGCDAIHVCNISPLRATDPRDLIDTMEAGIDVFQRERNDAALSLLATSCWGVVLAWGQNVGRHQALLERAQEVERLICAMAAGSVYALGFNADGTPRHPVRLANDTKFVRLERRAS